MRKFFALFIVGLFFLMACKVSKPTKSPFKKYSLSAVQKDYQVFRKTLERYHPSLYWYTSKDSMNLFFDRGYSQLKDSMTEPEFKKTLSYVMAAIGCGHSSVKSSKGLIAYLDTAKHLPLFPLNVKLLKDTVVANGSLNRADTVIYSGTRLLSINNLPIEKIVDSLIKFVSTDGHNKTHQRQWLSNPGNFASLYSLVFGIDTVYNVEYVDKSGRTNTLRTKPYIAALDSFQKKKPAVVDQPLHRLTKKDKKEQKLNRIRLMQIDTVGHTASLRLTSFSDGYKLKPYFKSVVRELEKDKIENLIIDLRSNGGGNLTNSILLARYISNEKFKVADSVYAITRRFPFSSPIEKFWQYKISMLSVTHLKKDGLYHFTYFEKHWFKPKRRHHFNRNTYLITGGNSFSATSIFANLLVKQENVTLVGEETGGGSYGNSGFMIPDVILPNTKVEFRLPLFRMVMDKNAPKTGRGVQPEIYAAPTISSFKKNIDPKIEAVMQEIKKKKSN
jgi:hypothetical protein